MSKFISFFLVLSLLTPCYSFANSSSIIEPNKVIVTPMVEPGAERYTVVWSKTDAHFVTKLEAGTNYFSSAAFWGFLTSGMSTSLGFVFSFFQDVVFIPQENDYVRTYTAITYDSVMNRFEWTARSTTTRNGKIVDDHQNSRIDNPGSQAYGVFMSDYGYKIPPSQRP